MKAMQLIKLLEVKAPKLREIILDLYNVTINPYEVVMGKKAPNRIGNIFELAKYLKTWGVKKVKLKNNGSIYREIKPTTILKGRKVYHEFSPRFEHPKEMKYLDYLLGLEKKQIDKLQLDYLDQDEIELPKTTKPKVDID